MATFTRTEVAPGHFDYHVTLFNTSSLAGADIVFTHFGLKNPASLSNLSGPSGWSGSTAIYLTEPGTTFAEYWLEAPLADADLAPPPPSAGGSTSLSPGTRLSGFQFRTDRVFDAFVFETYHRDPSNPSNLLTANGQAHLNPEPATLLLLLAGGVPLAALLRRRAVRLRS
ncbi:MAG: PEP-CTERM sorting domain-containing protein [Armatimonadetes bacterium]|nr:PEP-CTERM sorting domain-containing protein [Armatimonadota bacterium]